MLLVHLLITTDVFVNRRPKPPPEKNGCFCPYIEGEPGCVAGGCLNRSQNIECVPWLCECGVRCSNQRFQRRSYAAVMPFRTENRGWGLLALEDIAKGRFVIEYVGEVINNTELEARMKATDRSTKHLYYLSLDDKDTIDASRKGNLARFINHSCEPNCVTDKWLVLSETRIGIFARTDIPAGTELTFDYNMHMSGPNKIPCLCGAPKCRKFL